MNQSCISLRDVLRVVFRHQRRAVAAFCVTFGLAVCVAQCSPTQYVSDAKLFIRIGRASVSLDPTATVGKLVSMSESREREINSTVEILKSRELLESVLAEVGIDSVLYGESSSSEAGLLESGPKQNAAVIAIHEKALRRLKKSLQCETAKNSNVITISSEAGSPELAQQILVAYLRAFKTHHLRLNRTSGSYEFFVEQSTRLKSQLEQAEQDLRDEKNQIGVSSIDGEKRMIENQVTSLERVLQSTRAALAAAEVKVRAVRATYPDVQPGADLRAGSDSSAAAIAGMQAELYKLQIRERELTAQYSQKHPRVAAIQEQVRQARHLFAIQRVTSEQARRVSLEAEIGELQAQYTQAKRHLLQLNEDQIRVNSLEQEVEQLAANYRKYRDHLEQARIDGALETDRISNVNIAQAPTHNAKPVGPQRALILTLGVIIASCFGLGITFVSEYFDDSFQTPGEIEQLLGLPVVLCVPNNDRESSLAS